jgi:hypothetical protein
VLHHSGFEIKLVETRIFCSVCRRKQKNQVIAQAKYFRAFYYYYAAILWENVPIVLHVPQPADMPKQNTLAEVWAQVEKDFTEAAAVLPKSWDAANVGRPTKGAATGYHV